MTSRGAPQILYVGLFRLPDLNAAAQRVVANAKGLRALGFDVVLAEVGDESGEAGPIERLPDYQGFKCYRLPMKERALRDHPRLGYGQVKSLLESLGNPRGVIAYDYPAIPLARLNAYCRRHDMVCMADVTEWYDTASRRGFGRLAKWLDVSLRMRVVHKRLDALVVISKYLEDYYRPAKRPVVVRIPPLVDTTESKWLHRPKRLISERLELVYAGSPSASKERLDLVVGAVVEVAKTVPVNLNIVGITLEQFKAMYPVSQESEFPGVTFLGRVPHLEALAYVEQADFSVIVRDRSRLTDAGFPTKFVESVTMGTPVMTTPHPDLSEMVRGGKNGVIVTHDTLAREIKRCSGQSAVQMEPETFDFRNFEANFTILTALMEPNS